MGMFDDVRIECTIDGVDDPAAIGWQTKSFEWPMMELYWITSEGRLLHEMTHTEDRSCKSAPDGSLARICGILTSVHDGWEDMNYSGAVEFYGCNHTTGAWIDVVAHFDDGRLVTPLRAVTTMTDSSPLVRPGQDAGVRRSGGTAEANPARQLSAAERLAPRANGWRSAAQVISFQAR